MKIQDVELLTGLSKDTIYYYENEGLISVKKDSNLDREYDEENVNSLKDIIVLLKLNITICRIKELKEEKLSLEDILKDKIKDLEHNEINIEGKKEIIKEILKNIDRGKKINLKEYVEDIEYIEAGDYANFISDLNELGQCSLISQIFTTLVCISPVISFYMDIEMKNYNLIGLKGGLAILSSIILALTWRNYLKQKNKKTGGTWGYILGCILAIILTFSIFIGIDWLQYKIFVPKNYLMYVFKPPYNYIIFLFEIEVLVIIIAILLKRRKKNLYEYEWANNLFNFMKKNLIKVSLLNLVLLYICITGITVITEDKIMDYNFYNPTGIDYTYDDITNVNVGFLGKRKLLYGNKGDFYYKVTLKDNKQIDISEGTSDFDDTYLELELFDKLVMDKSHANKRSSKENYKLCDLDKRYVDRFLRIIKN